MRKQTKGIDVYRHTKALLEKHQLDARKGHAMLSSLARKDLTGLLSGTYTRKQTAGAFARHAAPPDKPETGRRRQLTARKLANRGLKAAIPVNPVNVQSGRLRRGVRLKKGSRGAQNYRLGISGVAYAKYVLAEGGTRNTVSREVRPALRKRWRPRNKALLEHLRASRATP